ncbi:MAG: hypothetical protein KGN16_01245 [Burkholderiales bacterium]|nr:hypothetical protein [Burkholderiales bacterium]
MSTLAPSIHPSGNPLDEQRRRLLPLDPMSHDSVQPKGCVDLTLVTPASFTGILWRRSGRWRDVRARPPRWRDPMR